MNFSSLRQQKRWSHLPFQSLRFQTEGSSAVVAFQLNGVVSGGERWLSVCGCLKSSVLRKRNKNMNHSTYDQKKLLYFKSISKSSSFL